MRRFERYSTGRSEIRESLAKRSTDPLVTLQELEEISGLPPGTAPTKLAHLRINVVGDWAGRPSVSLSDAAKAYIQITGDVEDQQARWQHYQQYLTDREERRVQAANQAAAQAREETRGRGTPQEESNAAQAATAARQAFDEREPIIGFDEYRPGGDST